jgi:hypothetical protein
MNSMIAQGGQEFLLGKVDVLQALLKKVFQLFGSWAFVILHMRSPHVFEIQRSVRRAVPRGRTAVQSGSD